MSSQGQGLVGAIGEHTKFGKVAKELSKVETELVRLLALASSAGIARRGVNPWWRMTVFMWSGGIILWVHVVK